jgi:23S rRNA (pseudouridine1915-N3)-methyltransferase
VETAAAAPRNAPSRFVTAPSRGGSTLELKITILAIAKLGRAPEAAMARDYADRATASGRSLGLGPVDILELESRKPGKAAEGELLLEHLQDAHVIACDEHGKAHPSRAFAARIAKLRDDGVRRLVLIIGGADGLAPEVLARADETVAFGVQTWPHALVRVMLAEQVYRAVTILQGSPYHRD